MLAQNDITSLVHNRIGLSLHYSKLLIQSDYADKKDRFFILLPANTLRIELSMMPCHKSDTQHHAVA